MITGKNKVSPFIRLVLNFKDSLAKPVAVVVQPLSWVQLFATPWTAACQASLSFSISQSLLNSCPLSWWCHPTISSSIVPSSSCLQSFPASGSFPIIQLFASGGQSWSFSFSISPFSEFSVLIIFGCLFHNWLSFNRMILKMPFKVRRLGDIRISFKNLWKKKGVLLFLLPQMRYKMLLYTVDFTIWKVGSMNILSRV